MTVPIVILTHRLRPVKTLKVFPSAILCVPKSEEAAYRDKFPNVEIVAHPDDIGSKRKWTFDHFGDVFMTEDDVLAMVRRWVGRKKDMPWRLTPEEADERIQITAETARALGAGLFGFSMFHSPMTEPEYLRPFGFTGVVLGSFGVLKSLDTRVQFPEKRFYHEDMYFSALNAYYCRYLFVDRRFAVKYEYYKTVQGNWQLSRSEEMEREAYLELKRGFGSRFTLRENRRGGKPKRHTYRYQPSYVDPF